MFEIATQFNAIFRAPQISHTVNGTASENGVGSSGSRNNIRKNEVAVPLLSMWTSRRIQNFLKILSSHLQLMEDSGSLRDALDACVFFTGSMGRLGADFTAQLPVLFEQKLLALVLHIWKDGTNQLAETLKICRDAGVANPLVSSTAVTPSSLTTDNNNNNDSNGEDYDSCSSTKIMAPPRQLMALPPLGRLVNACLMGLNELRRCLMPGIFSQLRVAIEDDFLLETKNILHAHERAVLSPGLRGDAKKLRAIAKRMKNTTKSIIFPYIRGAVELSIGNDMGAKKHFEKLNDFLHPPPPSPPPILLDEDHNNEGKKNAVNQKAEHSEDAGKPEDEKLPCKKEII